MWFLDSSGGSDTETGERELQILLAADGRIRLGGADASSGGMPGSSNSYFALLRVWLEKHKEYPSSARRRRTQGTAVLNFTISRDGNVQRARIERSSGYQVLDREVLAMIERANPLPPFPGDFQNDVITLSVPVQFRLR